MSSERNQMQKLHSILFNLCKIFREGKSIVTEIKSLGAKNGWEQEGAAYFWGDANTLSPDTHLKWVNFMVCVIPQ